MDSSKRPMMKRSLSGVIGLTALFLFGCAPQTTTQGQVQPDMSQPASLPDLGPAPELTNDTWLNVDSPLRLANLRGKVVIVEMWTFGCSNCQNVMPSLKEWPAKYKDQGLVLIGNHFPEFFL